MEREVFVVEDVALKHAEPGESDWLWKAALCELKALHCLFSDPLEFQHHMGIWLQNYIDCGVFVESDVFGTMVLGAVSLEKNEPECVTAERDLFRNLF